MCGIVGSVGAPQPRARVEEAVRRLAHRGPDDAGIERHDTAAGEAWLGFRRLSIQDPSPAGHQPMADASGRLRIVYNGEVYNFRALRRELEGKGHAFRTGTDTEVLLAGWNEWGEGLLPRLIGMFAFALLDVASGELVLVRDRLGIKPLYYASIDGASTDRASADARTSLAFASEVKALLALDGLQPRVDPASLARFLTFLWVPPPDTLLDGVAQLLPGEAARFKDGRLEKWRWWTLPAGEMDRPSEGEAIDRLDAMLHEAVRDRLVSDVPLGAFLSGGVDSTLVVALMRAAGVDRVTTQTVVFPPEDRRYQIEGDDGPWARVARDFFGDLDYHEQTLSPDVASLLPQLVWHLDDPVADPAAIATYLICRAARSSATVMLSGMGAEELYAGYPRHRAVLLAERYNRIPGLLREHVVEAIVERLPASRPGPWMRVGRNAKKFVKGAARPFEQRYLSYLSYYDADELSRVLKTPAGDPWGRHGELLRETRGMDPVARMSRLDLQTFLPGLNLAYTDRASMAASVEVRVPLLDHRVVEYVTGLPSDMKLRGGDSKWILKQVALRHVPEEIVRRPKAGFAAPVRAWVQGPLRPMIHELLDRDRLRERGWLDPEGVWQVLEAQWAGREDNALRIWAFLTLELWAATFLDRDGSAPLSADFAPARARQEVAC
jgi:asparagine synthase (glutamine-hydrolysing)